jgi:hypothetical protein
VNPPKQWVIYEENKPKVIRDIRDGRMDYVDLSSWGFLDRFFAFLIAARFFEFCASSYPSPRVKVEIPPWFLLAAAIQMKLHTENAFYKLKAILRSGSILSRLGFNIGLKDGGFNYKNKNQRLIPIDQDTARKYFRDSDPDKLQRWFNVDIARWFREHRALGRTGIFILDQSLIPLPDNPNYENSSYLPIDDDGNYVDISKLSANERRMIKPKPCYSLTSLLHLGGDEDYFIYAAAHVGHGSESALLQGEKLVDGFMANFGKGVIKILIMDKGFIDGAMIERFKKKHKIDVIVPLRSNMDANLDAMSLAMMADQRWQTYRRVTDSAGNITYREEIVGISDVRSWDECDLALYVGLMRCIDVAAGSEHIWALASTKNYDDPSELFDLYRRRVQIEERHRQLKGCWLLGAFKSTAFSLVVAHIIFVLLTYSLLELYLKKKGLERLANRTIESMRAEEALGKNCSIVYCGGYFGIFDIDEYTDIIINLSEDARRRLSKWIKQFRRRKMRSPPSTIKSG